MAGAVIKLSRLTPLKSLRTVDGFGSRSAESVNARVVRLIAWTQRRPSPAQGYSLRYALCAAAAVAVTVAVTYSDSRALCTRPRISS